MNNTGNARLMQGIELPRMPRKGYPNVGVPTTYPNVGITTAANIKGAAEKAERNAEAARKAARNAWRAKEIAKLKGELEALRAKYEANSKPPKTPWYALGGRRTRRRRNRNRKTRRYQ